MITNIEHEDKRTLVWAIYVLAQYEISKEEFEGRSIKCLDEIWELSQPAPVDNETNIFTEKQMQQAWNNGSDCNENRCGSFDIEDYR